MKKKVSIIDDNSALLTSLSLQFQLLGYSITTFACPERALQFHSKQPADFYIIDISMPKLTGIEFYEQLCEILGEKKIPALFLTAVDNAEARCLKKTTIGDFVRKPFNFDGLLARIEKILITTSSPNLNSYQIGNLKLYEDKIMCTWFDKEIELTKKEFELLYRLARRPRVVITREQLLEACYKDNYEVNDRSIDSHVKRIRKKFRKIHPEKVFNRIKSNYGSGYSWHPQSTIQ